MFKKTGAVAEVNGIYVEEKKRSGRPKKKQEDVSDIR